MTWFFKWYFRLDETWSIRDTRDEPYTTDITLSWLRKITDGHYDFLDKMGARFSDDSEIDYVYWDNFWLMYESDYYPKDWLPITVPEHV